MFWSKKVNQNKIKESLGKQAAQFSKNHILSNEDQLGVQVFREKSGIGFFHHWMGSEGREFR
jgi:hypothetical protein